MFIGGHRSLDWGGVEPEAEFFLLNHQLPSCTSSVRVLLGDQYWRHSVQPSYTLGQMHTAVLFSHLWTDGWGEEAGLRKGYSICRELLKDQQRVP